MHLFVFSACLLERFGYLLPIMYQYQLYSCVGSLVVYEYVNRKSVAYVRTRRHSTYLLSNQTDDNVNNLISSTRLYWQLETSIWQILYIHKR